MTLQDILDLLHVGIGRDREVTHELFLPSREALDVLRKDRLPLLRLEEPADAFHFDVRVAGICAALDVFGGAVAQFTEPHPAIRNLFRPLQRLVFLQPGREGPSRSDCGQQRNIRPHLLKKHHYRVFKPRIHKRKILAVVSVRDVKLEGDFEYHDSYCQRELRIR